ncbi:hypothetical protein BH23ACT9_BH23ACT9_09090 [soil metagenome]
MGLVEGLEEALGCAVLRELDGGHQSRVLEVSHRTGTMIAKAVRADAVDRSQLRARCEVVTRLAEMGQPVCRPFVVAENWIVEVGGGDDLAHLVVCSELAAGVEPNVEVGDDAMAMGALLARLHAAMALLPLTALPTVAALVASPAAPELELSPVQLLHGDFSASNMRRHGADLTVFDFDDCAYGPPEFDIANALYMVLFDAEVHGTPETYQTFRPAFTEGYAAEAGRSPRDATFDALIGARIRALGMWLDDLSTAPIGIRDASAEWHEVLRAFVRARS